MSDRALYGYLLEFTHIDALIDAADTLVDQGYRKIEAYTPFPIEELEKILPPVSNPIPALMFAGGLLGGLIGYGIQYFSAVIDYPILVGGKPMHSWPAFIPVTFELMVLFSAITGFLAVFWVNGLPRLHHPLFEAENFNLVGRDRFFIVIEAGDNNFDADRTWQEIDQIPHSKPTSISCR